MVVPISETLLQINSGTNFFVYCYCDKAFHDLLQANARKVSSFFGFTDNSSPADEVGAPLHRPNLLPPPVHEFSAVTPVKHQALAVAGV